MRHKDELVRDTTLYDQETIEKLERTIIDETRRGNKHISFHMTKEQFHRLVEEIRDAGFNCRFLEGGRCSSSKLVITI